MIESIKEAESLAETEFSELFHGARTTSPKIFTGVSVAIKETESGIEVGKVVKTRQGEHYHVRDTSWDGVVSLPVRSFMRTEEAKQEIIRQLKEFKRIREYGH